MSSIGETLREARLQRGLELEQIAAETRIRTHYLEWMEADRFDNLPAGFLQHSFLRQYARALRLNDQEILALFRELHESPSPAADPPRPEPLPRLPPLPRPPWQLAWVAAAIIACVIGSRVWNNGMPRLPKPETSAARVVALPEPPGPQPSPESLKPQAAVRVALKAKEAVWLTVKSDGADAFRGTLAQEESKEFQATEKVTILAGNAGGLEVSLNGRPIGPIGASGEVRMLELTPEGFRVIPRAMASSRTSAPSDTHHD